MRTETNAGSHAGAHAWSHGTIDLPVNVVTVAAVDALGEVFGGQAPGRDQVRDEIQRAVNDAITGAQQGAAAAGRAAADQARIQAEIARTQAAVDQMQAQIEARGGNMTITREGNSVVIHAPDGRVIRVDQSLAGPMMGRFFQGAVPPDRPPSRNDGPPDSVVALVGVIFVCLTIMVVGWAWARAFARRAEARAAHGGAPAPDVALRLERIEQAVDAMAVEMERVSEAQRYSARLLTERLPDPTSQLAAAHAAGTIPDR